MIDTTPRNVHSLNQINDNITRIGVIDQQIINPCGLCYQCYKYGPDFLFGKLRIRDSRDEPHVPAKGKLLSLQMQMNKLFNNNDERKIIRCYRNIHKSMKIPYGIYQTNKKLFVTVQPKYACKLEFAYHLWLPFIYRPQSDIVKFAIINFHIYNILVKKCKRGIGTNNIISFN